MSKSAIISSKGQVVVPKKIRDLYSLEQNSRVTFEPAGEVIIVRPLKVESTIDLDKELANFETEPNFKKEWEKSLAEKLKKWKW